jgi:hypothetical protein
MMKTKKEWMLLIILALLGLLAAGCGKAEAPAETPSVTPTAVATQAPVREDTPEPGVPCELPLPAGGDWQPLLCETFDDNSHGWQEETQDNPYAAYTSAVQDGKFMVDYRAKSFAAFTRNALTWFDVAEERNFVLAVTGQIESTFTESSWGIAFRGDEESFLLLSLQNDDSYALEVYEDNRWLPLITRRQTNLIKVGEPNTVRIEASGGDFFFSINGEMVNQYSGATLAGDDILLVVSAKEGASAIFTFDDVVLLK